MSNEEFSRQAALIGENAVKDLFGKHVAIFGVGGVGGYVCEALARSGIGKFTIVDGDIVALSNINRQIIALHSTLGQCKTFVMKKRICDINENVRVNTIDAFIDENNIDCIKMDQFDYIVDAIDTMRTKVLIVQKAKISNVPIISSMGAANRLDPTKFEISDIYKTSGCPVARIMRRELRKINVDKLNVVYSKEIPKKPRVNEKPVLGSVSFVPPVMGMILASKVISDLI